MKRSLFLFLTLLALASCRQVPVHPFLAQAQNLYDLETGEPLSLRKAGQAAGVFGEWRDSLYGSPQAISFIRFNPDEYVINVVSAQEEQADSTSALCARANAVAGINGSYFDMQALTAETFIKDDGVDVSGTSPAETFRTNGLLLLNQEHILIEESDTTQTEGDKWWECMASGPILLDEGTSLTYSSESGFYQNRHPRSLIGMDADGYCWLVVVDGRADGEAAGMTIEELTHFAEGLGLTDALNLDGGGSSTLWTLVAGVLNHPSDNGRFDHEGQRVVPNILAIERAR